MIDLNDLLTRSADKDPAAFKALYNATSPRLFSVLMGMLKNESLAEDILQDSYLKIWEKAKIFKANKSSAMTWMRTIPLTLPEINYERLRCVIIKMNVVIISKT